MKKIFSTALVILILALMLCLILYPNRYITASINGITLWAFSVLPTLLPFFFLTALLTSTNSVSKLASKFNRITQGLYRTGGISVYVHIMSILSGYPVGAKLICDLKQNGFITKHEATRMSTFCSTSGPLFIVGSVGIAMFNDKKMGFIFLIVHIISSILCGLCFRFYGKNFTTENKAIINKTHDNVLYECMYQSVISVLIVGGFVAVFYTISQILHDFSVLCVFEMPLSKIIGEENAIGFVQGLIECTKGCKLLSLYPTTLSLCLSCGLISFGGFSIICQSIVFLKKAEVNIAIFIISKILQMLFSIILCFIICLL